MALANGTTEVKDASVAVKDRIAQVHLKALEARSNRTHCLTLARFVSKLQPIIREVELVTSLGSQANGVAGPALKGVVLDVLNRVLDLVERAGGMGKCRAIILAEAVIAEFQDVTRQLGEYLTSINRFDLHLAEDVNEDIEHLQSQLSRLKYRESKKVQELSNAIRQLVCSQTCNSTGVNAALLHLLRQVLNMAKLLDTEANVANISDRQKQALEQELKDVAEQVQITLTAANAAPTTSRSSNKNGAKSVLSAEDNHELWLQVERTLKHIVDGVPEPSTSSEEDAMGDGHDLHDSSEPPEAFLCPISLEIMVEPVIMVETAMTYDKTSIEQHFAAGHSICPLSGSMLISKRMLPNYTLRSAIQAWARQHKYPMPQRTTGPAPINAPRLLSISGGSSGGSAGPLGDPSSTREMHGVESEWQGAAGGLEGAPSTDSSTLEGFSDVPENIPELVREMELAGPDSIEPIVRKICAMTDRNNMARTQMRQSNGIHILVRWLTQGTPSSRGAVAKALWYCARDDDNTAVIAAAGAISPLVQLLWGGNNEAKEAAARAFWNLSTYNQSNKVAIAKAGAIPALVHVLTYGCPASKEASAGALRSLAVNDDNETEIVRAGAVPALVNMLTIGTDTGKEVALGALHNLARTDWRSEVASARVVEILQQLSASPTVKKEVQRQAVNLLRRFCEGLQEA